MYISPAEGPSAKGMGGYNFPPRQKHKQPVPGKTCGATSLDTVSPGHNNAIHFVQESAL